MNRLLEICAGDPQSVAAAACGGAHRVELCSGLAEGGLTPSAGAIAQAVELGAIGVHVLIRPRPGDFLYSPTEVRLMLRDIDMARQLGAHGVVIGALTAQGQVDMAVCRQLMAQAQGMAVTFHRAFDLCRSLPQALEQLVELGCSRVLTSGGAATALQGAPMLRQLVEASAGRIIILAGCGVSATNAAQIVRQSGVSELHASARALCPSPMAYRAQGVSMGTPGTDEYARLSTHEAIVREILNEINKQ